MLDVVLTERLPARNTRYLPLGKTHGMNLRYICARYVRNTAKLGAARVSRRQFVCAGAGRGVYLSTFYILFIESYDINTLTHCTELPVSICMATTNIRKQVRL